jgi:hypothetical protein
MPEDEFQGVDVMRKYAILEQRRLRRENGGRGIVRTFSGFGETPVPAVPASTGQPNVAQLSPGTTVSEPGAGNRAQQAQWQLQLAATLARDRGQTHSQAGRSDRRAPGGCPGTPGPAAGSGSYLRPLASGNNDRREELRTWQQF